ncbi:cold-responsive protein kinase 1-like [Tasmannia lanceolata]|uniref:cold-responsive protein kinase 1-like n=1 Tax=Tasmannia lanceolata TaxID=3420 RepID=UPI0040635107
MTGGRGTPGYATPELWMPFPTTQKCEVYSFGMLLFEIVGRRRNLDVNLPESQEWFPRLVWEKFEKYSPDARTPMSSVVKILLGEAEIVTRPPNPFQHMVSMTGLVVWRDSDANSTATGGITEISDSVATGGTAEICCIDSTPFMKKYEMEVEITNSS